MQVILVMFRADGERRKFSVVRDMTVIGRREDCDLRIPLGDVSRKHCRLIKDGDTIRVEDLGSSNGTFHDGEKIKDATTLFAGSSIRVGPVTFVVQIDGVPPEEDMKPTEAKPITLDDDDFMAVEASQPGVEVSEPAAAENGEEAAEVAEGAEAPAEAVAEADEVTTATSPASAAPAAMSPEDSVQFEFDLSDEPAGEGNPAIDDEIEFHLEDQHSSSASGQHPA